MDRESITVESVYFITILSRSGVAVKLKGSVHCVGTLSVHDYINTYCVPGTQKSGSQIPIAQITSFPLKVIVTTITRVSHIASLHLATHNYMHLY